MSVASRLPASWLAEFLLLAALWGASFLFMRIAVPEFGALVAWFWLKDKQSVMGLLIGFCGLLLPALWLWPATMPSPKAWSATLAVGTFCTALAYILYFRMIAAGGAARAMSVTYLIPVFAILYGMIFLGESVTPWMLGCGVVILLGTALSTGALARARVHL